MLEFVSVEFGDVAITFYLGPMFFQYAPAERIDLDLPAAGHAGALEAEIEAADAGEERAESHLALSGACCWSWQS